MDREMLDLIADYVEARRLERDYPIGGFPIGPTSDEIAERIIARGSQTPA